MNKKKFQEYIELAEEGAMKLASMKLVREKLKQYLSIETARYINLGYPVSKAQELARASDSYKERLDQATETVAEGETIRAKMKGIEMEHEYWRSKESSRRAEMKLT